jgi:hypothetical protein
MNLNSFNIQNFNSRWENLNNIQSNQYSFQSYNAYANVFPFLYWQSKDAYFYFTFC